MWLSIDLRLPDGFGRIQESKSSSISARICDKMKNNGVEKKRFVLEQKLLLETSNTSRKLGIYLYRATCQLRRKHSCILKTLSFLRKLQRPSLVFYKLKKVVKKSGMMIPVLR